MNNKKLRCYLLDLEASPVKMMRGAPGVINFFEVLDEFPETWLYDRVNQIYKLNPWMGGRLKKTNKGTALVFKERERFSGFNVIYNSGISFRKQWDEIYSNPHFGKMAAPNGTEAMKDSSQPLVKFTLFKEGTKEVGLGVSICHAIGDGRTLYQIMSMMDKNVKPYMLYPKRITEFSKDVNVSLGDEFNWHISKTHLVGAIANVMLNPLEADHKMHYMEFSGEGFESEKKKYSKGSEFVSTNDVLTSWFCNQLDIDYVLMMVDFRGRVKGVTNEHAGNYSHDVVLNRRQFATPKSVRQVVNGLNKDGKKEPAIPTIMETMYQNSFMLTSWVTFYHDVNIPGCVNRIQLPFWSKEGMTKIPWKHAACVFRPRAGEIAVTWASKTHSSAEAQKKIKASSPIVRSYQKCAPGKHLAYQKVQSHHDKGSLVYDRNIVDSVSSNGAGSVSSERSSVGAVENISHSVRVGISVDSVSAGTSKVSNEPVRQLGSKEVFVKS